MNDAGDIMAYANSAIARVPRLTGIDASQRDPITEEQIQVLVTLLRGPVSDEELEGFLVVCSRFVDEFGGHRTDELAEVFRTSTAEGREALRQSLRYINRWVGGYARYESQFPVRPFPARPAFPLFKVVGVEQIAKTLYRVFDSQAKICETGEPISDLIARTGRLPGVPRQARPVRRSKPRLHWCSYTAWESPAATRDALQILPEWKSDCSMRASISALRVSHSTFVAFKGDSKPEYAPDGRELKFAGYFYEPTAQDHPALPGGGLQVGVAGAPRVFMLEKWSRSEGDWRVVWRE